MIPERQGHLSVNQKTVGGTQQLLASCIQARFKPMHGYTCPAPELITHGNMIGGLSHTMQQSHNATTSMRKAQHHVLSTI
jgi:hypothetical protein